MKCALRGVHAASGHPALHRCHMEIIMPCNDTDADDDDVLDYRANPKSAADDEDAPKEYPLDGPTPALWPVVWP